MNSNERGIDIAAVTYVLVNDLFGFEGAEVVTKSFDFTVIGPLGP